MAAGIKYIVPNGKRTLENGQINGQINSLKEIVVHARHNYYVALPTTAEC